MELDIRVIGVVFVIAVIVLAVFAFFGPSGLFDDDDHFYG